MVSSFAGCSSKGSNSSSSVAKSSDSEMWMPFSEYTSSDHNTSGRSSIIEHTSSDEKLRGFATDFCVFEGDVSSNDFIPEHSTAGLLINVDSNDVLYANNAFEKRYPASLTKLLTAYTSLQYLSENSIVTVSSEAIDSITDPTAVMLNIHAGDNMTISQALRLMLLSSYNDVAEAIGCQSGETIDGFAAQMNQAALELGCTGTHFVNASGLHDDNHYTTAYDLYLIFKEVVNDPVLYEIIQMRDYSTTIKRADGTDRSVNALNTNQYFRGNYSTPDNLVILGGKTGTTEEAGRCLVLYVRDTNSTPYIAVVMGAESMDELYTEMTNMLSLCNKSVN